MKNAQGLWKVPTYLYPMICAECLARYGHLLPNTHEIWAIQRRVLGLPGNLWYPFTPCANPLYMYLVSEGKMLKRGKG